MTQKYKGNGGEKHSSGMLSRPTPFHPQPQTLQQLLSQGEELARVMESPVINLAWSWTIQSLTEEWLESAPEEKAKQQDLHRMIQLLSRLKKTMSHYVEMAKMEHQKMLQQEQLNRQAMEAGVPVDEL